MDSAASWITLNTERVRNANLLSQVLFKLGPRIKPLREECLSGSHHVIIIA
jgi:hypothetical protein